MGNEVDLGTALALLLVGVFLGIPVGWGIATAIAHGQTYTVQKDSSGNITAVTKD